MRTDPPDPAEPKPGAPARSLVTGGAGFIGSHLVEALLARGDDVTVVDDLSTGRRANLPPGGAPRLRVVPEGVAPGLARLRDEGARFDRVFHLAAAVGVQRVIERTAESVETNVAGAAEVFRFAVDRGPGPGRPALTLFASSSEVYGKSERVPFAEGDDCVLGPAPALRWSYAASKMLGEHLALAHHERDGLPVVIVRFFNTVGPRQVGEYGMVLPRFVGAALAGRPLEVHGDGSQTRCFCDVRDAVPAVVALTDTARHAGGIFNLGSDEPVSIADLARLVNETLGNGAGFRTVPYHDALGPAFEDLTHRRPDLTRIRGAVGFRPAIPLHRTIRDLAEQPTGAGAS